jgi:diguanylate cyclase (GGDEF)-like protein
VTDFRKLVPRTFWSVSLAAAIVLSSIVAVPQWLSKQERLQVLRAHVAEVAQLAASVVDGDLHRQLIEPANYDPELYRRTLAPLVRFHSAAPEIFYVYTMVERDGKSYFVVDTAASEQLKTSHELRPSKYNELFEPFDEDADADWLQRIATGKTYVYPSFQTDVYGTFLSGHKAIYDSQGRYSGFVGVDFDPGYYLAQEASFRVISIGTLAAAGLVALLIGYLAARQHYEINRRIDEQYRLSIRDELTTLLNRRGALASAQAALESRADGYATILIDVDDLKGINDCYGHAAGDDFLREVAGAIRQCARATDVCARLGGDEFLVFAPGCDLERASQIARNLLELLYRQDAAAGRSHFGVSIGIDIAPPDAANFQTLYRLADQALYMAKAAGRNRFVVSASLATA